MVRTAEELIADRRWRRRHSAYLLWAIPLLGFVAILYTGIRARRRDWIVWGVVYALVVIGVLAVVPDDTEPPFVYLFDLVLLAAWIGSSAQLLASREDWLQWKADQHERKRRGPYRVSPPSPPAAWGTAAPTTTTGSQATPARWDVPATAQGGWGSLPTGGVPPTAGLPSQPAPRRRRPRRLVLILIGTGVVVMLGLVAVLTSVVFTDDLLEVEFRNGSEPFLTGESPDYVIDLVDGTYRIRSRAGAPRGASSFARFPRRAYAVDMSADVVSVSPTSGFGVASWHSREGDGYALVAHTDGGVGLVRLEAMSAASGDSGTPLALDEAVSVPTANVRLRLTCDNSLTGSNVSLVGYVNGERVIEARDPDGFDGFVAGVLMFQSNTPDGEIRFSRAKAIVTGSDE
jgi:hypothetical protein